MNDLLELAERVERLMGWDRETDALIDAALRVGKADHPEWIRKNFSVWRGRQDGRCEVVFMDGKGGVHWESASFTASIDAAMTLVPEGWYGRVEPRFHSDEGEVTWLAYAIRPDWSKWHPHDDWCKNVEGRNNKYPALALCAASLRAHADTAGVLDNG